MGKVDVIIVGAGMAGLSTALEISSNSSLEVLLVEKERVGANGHSPLVPTEILQDYGLEGSILQHYSGLICESPSGFSGVYDFGRVAYACIDYEKACGILLRRAADNGVRMERASAIDWSPSRPDPTKPLSVSLDDGRVVDAQLLVDASGHGQWASKRLGLGGSGYYCHCLGEYFSGCEVDDLSYFSFLWPCQAYGNGGGWFYPIGRDASAVIGYCNVTKSSKPKEGVLIEGYSRAKAEFKPYAQRVRKGTTERIESGTIPLGRIGRFFADRVLVVGDAAGQAHPWVIMGCGPALDNGRLCGQAVVSAFEKGRFDNAQLSVYEKLWNKNNREPFWRAASISDIQWARSDEQWDGLLRIYAKGTPDQVLRFIRNNHASAFEKAYAVAGYLRRGLVKWLVDRRRPARGEWTPSTE